ncbi:MAG: patatin-like phospholipase family protein, partial [Candidatus Binatia bacterium]
CIRQADRILIVCCSDADPALSQIEAEVLADNAHRTTARRELVLLHPNESHLAVDTAKWIEHRSIDAHHHIASTSRSDLERLVRPLTGEAVGLVLSGGGARGFAHIGAIRALKEAGIPIDLIGGTSIGALIAAQFALGWNHDTIRSANKDGWLTLKPLRDYTLPLVALNAGRKINKMLTQMFGNIHIEDLWLPYFCVSTDLTRAELLVHRNGLLWESVRASMAIPGIGPPSFFNGNVLVDGGLLNNLPVDIMATFCEGKILAVDVGQRVDLRSNVCGPQTVSGWKLLWNKINPFATKDDIPGIFNILYRTTMVNSVRHQDLTKNQADFYVHLPVGHIGTFDWQALDQLIEIGYRTTQKKIEEGYRSVRKVHS